MVRPRGAVVSWALDAPSARFPRPWLEKSKCLSRLRGSDRGSFKQIFSGVAERAIGHYAVGHYAAGHYAARHYAVTHYAVAYYAVAYYAVAHYAVIHYAVGTLRRSSHLVDRGSRSSIQKGRSRIRVRQCSKYSTWPERPARFVLANFLYA